MSAAPPPVFVDDTGRRRILTRRAGRIVVLGFTGYLGLVALGFARDPGVGPVHLPTFGLPSLGLVVPPAPAVLGEGATRPAADAGSGEAEQATAPQGEVESQSSTTTVRPTVRPTVPPTAGGPTASRAMAPKTGVPGSNSSTTTSPSTSSSSTSTTSSTAPTTTSNLPGQGQGQGLVQRSDAASTKGPGDSAPPGQQRKTTTTTAG